MLNTTSGGSRLYAAGLTTEALGRDTTAIAEQAYKDNPWLATESEDDDAWAAGED